LANSAANTQIAQISRLVTPRQTQKDGNETVDIASNCSLGLNSFMCADSLTSTASITNDSNSRNSNGNINTDPDSNINANDRRFAHN